MAVSAHAVGLTLICLKAALRLLDILPGLILPFLECLLMVPPMLKIAEDPNVIDGDMVALLLERSLGVRLWVVMGWCYRVVLGYR